MIYRDENGFQLAPYKVSYTQNGEAETNYTDDKKTWEGYQELGHISDLTFEEMAYSEEQLARLEEVKDSPESEYPFIEEYVLEGTVNEASTLSKDLRIKELEKLNSGLRAEDMNNKEAILELYSIVLGGL